VKQSQQRWWPLCFEGDDSKRGLCLTSKWPGSFAALAPPLQKCDGSGHWRICLAFKCVAVTEPIDTAVMRNPKHP